MHIKYLVILLLLNLFLQEYHDVKNLDLNVTKKEIVSKDYFVDFEGAFSTSAKNKFESNKKKMHIAQNMY